MKADIDTRLTDNGEFWFVNGEDLTASGRTLDDLDADLKRAMIESGRFEPGSEVTVFMGYDFSGIPTWLRQYHYHYFNRLVTLEL